MSQNMQISKINVSKYWSVCLKCGPFHYFQHENNGFAASKYTKEETIAIWDVLFALVWLILLVRCTQNENMCYMWPNTIIICIWMVVHVLTYCCFWPISVRNVMFGAIATLRNRYKNVIISVYLVPYV
jgi:hypothetical protein